MSANEVRHTDLLIALNQIVRSGKSRILASINSTISLVYWQVGSRINQELLKGDRATYGQQVIKNASTHLTEQFGDGWGEKHLRHCIRFSEIFTDFEIVSTLCRQLSWSHFKEVLYIDDDLKRTFYIEMCQIEKWSVRTFRERIQSMLYERTAISKKPDELIKKELNALRNEKKLSGVIGPKKVKRAQ